MKLASMPGYICHQLKNLFLYHLKIISMKYENNPMLERYVELMIEKLKEVNADDWQQPWFSPQFKGIPQNLSGRTYNNLNKAVLYFICDKYNYQTPVFITFNQAKSAGIQILKGSKAFPVMFYELSIKDKVTGQRIDRSLYESLSQADKERYKVMPFLKYYNVFNLDQTNFTKKFPTKWESFKKQFSIDIEINSDRYRNKLIDRTIDNQSWVCPIKLERQSEAYYAPLEDVITLPTMQQFSDGKEFYYTALHEMAHSTGSSKRLGRTFGFRGSVLYAREELVAELTAAVVGRDLGFAVMPRKENAQYLKGWLTKISDDPQYLFNILSDVNKATTMIETGIHLEKGKVDTLSTDNIPVLTEEEYISSKGFCSNGIGDPALHKGRQQTARQQNKMVEFQKDKDKLYIDKRMELRQEYHEKRSKGELRPPTNEEKRIRAANGHPDLESTQAARHTAEKRGIVWNIEESSQLYITKFYYDDLQMLHAKYKFQGQEADRLVWQKGKEFSICTGCRSNNNFKEHILPPTEVSKIKSLNEILYLNGLANHYDSLGYPSIAKSITDNIRPNCLDNMFITDIKIVASDSKALYGDLQIPQNNKYLSETITNLRITDNSTGITEPLHIKNIDVCSHSSDQVKALLSGRKVELKNSDGISQLMNLNKTVAGWRISTAKQVFHEAGSSAEF